MKITKRQLRRIIREEKIRLLNEQPISGEQAIQMQQQQDEDPAHLARILKHLANRGTVTVEEGGLPDELYIMLGGSRNPELADGFTVRVLRSGR